MPVAPYYPPGLANLRHLHSNHLVGIARSAAYPEQRGRSPQEQAQRVDLGGSEHIGDVDMLGWMRRCAVSDERSAFKLSPYFTQEGATSSSILASLEFKPPHRNTNPNPHFHTERSVSASAIILSEIIDAAAFR